MASVGCDVGGFVLAQPPNNKKAAIQIVAKNFFINVSPPNRFGQKNLESSPLLF
jgi:hypothetical protein